MADWCELVLCLVLGNIAGLLHIYYDLLQPPGHEFHQGLQTVQRLQCGYDTHLSKSYGKLRFDGGGWCNLHKYTNQVSHRSTEWKLPPPLTTEVSYNIIITGPIDLKFSAGLPETHTFWNRYRRLLCDCGGWCNLHKYTDQILWRDCKWMVQYLQIFKNNY